MTALACVVGEIIVSSGDEAERMKGQFQKVLNAYVAPGIDGARTGPNDQKKLDTAT
jgi:hypothetical protein